MEVSTPPSPLEIAHALAECVYGRTNGCLVDAVSIEVRNLADEMAQADAYPWTACVLDAEDPCEPRTQLGSLYAGATSGEALAGLTKHLLDKTYQLRAKCEAACRMAANGPPPA